MQNKKNYNMSKLVVLGLLWNIVVFRLVVYLLNMIFLNLLLLYKIDIYNNFCIILTQFHINFWRQEHQIDVLYMYRSTLRFSGFIISPFSCFLYSPFNHHLVNHQNAELNTETKNQASNRHIYMSLGSSLQSHHLRVTPCIVYIHST